MGGARSGTTILGIILDNNPNIYHIGEIINADKRDFNPHYNNPDDVRRSLWAQVFSDEKEEISAISKMERHTKFLNALLNLNKKNTQNKYNEIQHKLMTRISKLTGSDVIIDSSKSPTRALLLKKTFGPSMNIIYLRRNFMDVVRSFRKKDVEQASRSFFSSTMYYVTINIACLLARLLHYKSTVYLSYNSLLKYPQIELKRIEKELNIDLANSISLIEKSNSLKINSIFDGNRIREKSSVAFVKKK